MTVVGVIDGLPVRVPKLLVGPVVEGRGNEALWSGRASPRPDSMPNSGEWPASLRLARSFVYVLCRLMWCWGDVPARVLPDRVLLCLRVFLVIRRLRVLLRVMSSAGGDREGRHSRNPLCPT